MSSSLRHSSGGLVYSRCALMVHDQHVSQGHAERHKRLLCNTLNKKTLKKEYLYRMKTLQAEARSAEPTQRCAT